MTPENILRISKVMKHLESYPDEPLNVESISKIACYSPYHFHRTFTENTDISIGVYRRLIKMRHASYQLAFRDKLSITSIAYDAGYENLESFSRAFKKVFNQSPSHFRNDPNWEIWHETFSPLTNVKDKFMPLDQSDYKVEITNFPETKIAELIHNGDPSTIMASVQKFIQWRKAEKLSPKTSETYNILYDDPLLTAPKDYRFGIAASTPKDIDKNTSRITNNTIPAGRCAKLRHIGRDDNIGESCSYLFEHWLSKSGEKLRDFPMFFHRVTLFPEVPENEMITDIYLPII